jgi:hypothetical protein
MTILSEFDAIFTLFRDGLASPGFGALVVAAVDDRGALDPHGFVEADVRVFSVSGCGGQTSFAYRPERAFEADAGALIGLTLGGAFRANVGIVNADTAPHAWHVRYGSLDGRSDSDFDVTVPAASSTIVALEPGDAGPISIRIDADSSGVAWRSWGASVDGRSGDAWYTSLIPVPAP